MEGERGRGREREVNSGKKRGGRETGRERERGRETARLWGFWPLQMTTF